MIFSDFPWFPLHSELSPWFHVHMLMLFLLDVLTVTSGSRRFPPVLPLGRCPSHPIATGVSRQQWFPLVSLPWLNLQYPLAIGNRPWFSRKIVQVSLILTGGFVWSMPPRSIGMQWPTVVPPTTSHGFHWKPLVGNGFREASIAPSVHLMSRNR